MSKDKILIVRFEKSPNAEICLILSVKRSSFAFMASASDIEDAKYLKDYIQEIGVKEYDQNLKSAGISRKLRLKSALKDMVLSGALDVTEIDEDDHV